MNSHFEFQRPKPLPVESLRDFINILRQDIKFKLFPFKFYYRYRAKKYAKYKTPELNLVKYLINADENSLDIGANLGLFTHFMTKYSKKVIALEPNPLPLRYLYNLVEDNVKVLPIAAGNKDKEIELIIPKSKKGWSSNGASIKAKNFKRFHKIKVQSRKIDSLQLKELGLIKIDVEGFEKEVIEGAKETIKAQKPNLIIENEIIHHDDPTSLFSILRNLNYEIFFCNNSRELQKVNHQFEFLKKQKNPEIKKYGYIQNFICIHQNKLKRYQNIIKN